MSSIFNLYPVLTSERIDKLGFKSEVTEFSYIEDYEDFLMSLEDINGNEHSFSARLRDPRCVWYPETHNLIIRKNCSISDVSSLFGPNGIVAHDSKIGIAGIWISTKSEHRGVVQCGEFKSGISSFSFSLEHKFEKNIVKGNLQFQIVLYLKNAGHPDNNEFHFANQPGTILGILEQCEIFIDGNGSVFPISTVNEPGKPLWWVYYDDNADPLVDMFDENNVEIRLNRAHPCFEALKIDSSLKESPLFLEVISSALLIIVNSVKEALGPEWDNVLCGQNFNQGSIAEAIYYFVNKLQWDVSSPSKLARSIHTYFDNNL